MPNLTAATVGKRRSRRRSVLDYGAIGDSQVDDTQALKDAFEDAGDNGYTLVFPHAGIFKISDYLFIYGKTTIIGNYSSIWLTNHGNTSPTVPYISFGVTALGSNPGLVNTFTGLVENLEFKVMEFSVSDQNTHGVVALISVDSFVFDGLSVNVVRSGSDVTPTYPRTITAVRQAGWIDPGAALPTRGTLRRINLRGLVHKWPPADATTNIRLDPNDGGHANSPFNIHDSYLGTRWDEPGSVNIYRDTQCNGMWVSYRDEYPEPYVWAYMNPNPPGGDKVGWELKDRGALVVMMDITGGNWGFAGILEVVNNVIGNDGMHLKCQRKALKAYSLANSGE